MKQHNKIMRTEIWENDISLNHDSTEPFMNVGLPNQIDEYIYRERWCWRDRFDDVGKFSETLKLDSYPMPCAKDRENYNIGADTDYFLNGLEDFYNLQEMTNTHSLKVNSYLDFGCASGRVLRHFACQSNIENLWGTDINGRHIKWVNEHLPKNIRAIHTSTIPHIPIADNSIDLVSAFSVFTHIDTFETAWLAELHRILTPNGLCYLTIHDENTWETIRSSDEKKFLYAKLEKCVDNIDELVAKELADGRSCFRHTDFGPYRALCFHSQSYIHSMWGRFFEIVDIKPMSHGRNQAVVITRKVS